MIEIPQITAKAVLSDDEAANLAGTTLGDDSFDTLVTESIRILKEDGSPLLIFRKGVLPLAHCKAAFDNLYDAAQSSYNRGMAGGTVDPEKTSYREDRIGTVSGTRYKPRLKDGTLSKTTYANSVQSGIVGYFDKAARFPYCRLTAFNINHPERFAAAMPLIRDVDRVFAENVPERYAAQKAIVEQTSPDFTISGTVFTTLTVNMNFQTAVHTDKGDYKPGFGVLTALRRGKFTGCYFVLPKYRIAADMKTGDVLLVDVHEWHGNSPIHPTGKYERLSLVFYYRDGMKECGTVEEELENARQHSGKWHLDWEE